MKVGDLVRIKQNQSKYKNYGLVVSILVDNLVGVMWAGTNYVHAEPIKMLEVVETKEETEERLWESWGDQ